jgi:biotin carboxyl carrier protein
MPTYQVTIGDRRVRVRLRRASDVIYAQVGDGPEQVVNLQTLRGPLRMLMVGEQWTELMAARRDDAVELTIDGIGYRAEVMDEAHARLAQVTAAGGASQGRRDLKAPMPGLVVKVLVEAGQTVEPGQPLIVLQAMKMENELSVPRGGAISSVVVKEGQTVEAGQILASLD